MNNTPGTSLSFSNNDHHLVNAFYLNLEALYHAVNNSIDKYAVILLNPEGRIILERSGGHFTAELGNYYYEARDKALDLIAKNQNYEEVYAVPNNAETEHRSWHSIAHCIMNSDETLAAIFCIVGKEMPSTNAMLILNPIALSAESTWKISENTPAIPNISKVKQIKPVNLNSIIGESKEIQHIKLQTEKAAKVNYNVLILGRSGTGKELVAQAIHSMNRPNGPFVAINCGASNKELLRSELFGYEDGAFTGAKKGGQIGKIMQANHGTLFLDEIGEMPLDTQVLLLRFLETGSVNPVGSLENFPVDVRIIAATNKDLLQDVINHKFRDDLFFRLNVIKIAIPPLSQRAEDIPLLIKHFLQEIAKDQAEEEIHITDKAVKLLTEYYWPGNVRQLKNALEQSFCNASSNVITEEMLPSSIRENINYCNYSEGNIRELERNAIENALQNSNGNVTKAAKALGISRATLYNKIAKMQISM